MTDQNRQTAGLGEYGEGANENPAPETEVDEDRDELTGADTTTDTTESPIPDQTTPPA